MTTPDPRTLDRRRRPAAVPAPAPGIVPSADLAVFLRALGCDPARMHHATINRDCVHVVQVAVDEHGRVRYSGGEPITERLRILIDRTGGDS